MFSDSTRGAPYSSASRRSPADRLQRHNGPLDRRGDDAVATITVSCVAAASLGGTVTARAGQTLTLSEAPPHDRRASGPSDFRTRSGRSAVRGQRRCPPAGQVCTLSINGNGMIDANDDPVTTIAVSCTSDGTVNGTVAGLASGSSELGAASARFRFRQWQPRLRRCLAAERLQRSADRATGGQTSRSRTATAPRRRRRSVGVTVTCM